MVTGRNRYNTQTATITKQVWTTKATKDFRQFSALLVVFAGKSHSNPTKKGLLEKLHLKYSQKPWNETIKLVRICLDKPVGPSLKGCINHPLLKCTDILQKALKEQSQSAILNRIECISKQNGLESHLGPSGRVCYITSEMFYIEVQVKKNGRVTDVKLAHHGEGPMISKELLQFLRKKDFEAFGRSLQGLLFLYNIPGNSEMKANVYLALRALETDLNGIANLYSSKNFYKGSRVTALLHGRVGIVTPRSAGMPMDIEYYASPCQLLQEKLNPGHEVVRSKMSVTIMATKIWHCLPISPLLNESQHTNGSTPVFKAVSESLSMDLPACFFLTFTDPVPLVIPSFQNLQNITGLPVFGIIQAPLHKLIIQVKNKMQETDDEARFTVSLPDCLDHCYVINSRLDNESATMGILVDKIPFTHPSHVPLILEVLRHQAAYNALISSCVPSTKDAKGNYSSSVMYSGPPSGESSNLLLFEVILQKDSRICVSFQHPSGDSLCCVTVDVLSSRQLKCSLYTNNADPNIPCDNEFILKVLERCMSIPITMRAIFKRAQKLENNNKMEILSAQCENSSLREGSVIIHPSPNSGQQQVDDNTNSKTTDLAADQNITQIRTSLEPSYSDPQELHSIITGGQYFEEPHFSTAEEPHPVIAEEPDSNIAEDLSIIPVEEPQSSLIETSSSMIEDPSSSFTEDLSSSIAEELSSSMIEELSVNMSGYTASEATGEIEPDHY
ncbi:mediator of RNA polymerase II transcription subunit 1-like [Bombina bombina]|uniref:mediator of RNA polymerase II transcription subunit 1-like n=1 Tax=Bombina bombina TaxID=8345 RepID=UPI00235AFCCB|nr:mediator of RNA polymerase II transcription subunit 1-like [Bombina bombina]